MFLRFEIHALGHETVQVVENHKFWYDLHVALSTCFVEMHTMLMMANTRTPCIMATNERLLKSFNVNYDGNATSRLTRKLRPPSPVKLLNHVFGSSQAGAGNSSPTKMAKPVLVVAERTKLPPPPGPSRMHSEAQQKITLVKDEQEGLDTSGIGVFVRLEKIIEVYVTGIKHLMLGFGWNLMGKPEPEESPDPDIYKREVESTTAYEGLVKFLRGEWNEKIGLMVGRSKLDELLVIYGKNSA